MPRQNYINLSDSDLDIPVYRIMPIERLLQTLENRQLVLVRPCKWEDPFENIFLSALLTTDEGMTGSFGFRDSVYGQCWTFEKETDAMWRIYSPKKQGIKVTTTPRKLLEALQAATKEFWELSCFIGRVQYQNEDTLLNTLQNIDWQNPDGSGIAKSLLYKRDEFTHEREIRLIYSAPDSTSNSDIHAFGIIPNELIEELVLDPRMDTELVKAFTLAIKNKEFNNSISQSSLYRAPKDLKISIQYD